MPNYYLVPTFHIVFRDVNSEPLINGRLRFSKASNHAIRKAVFEDREGTIAYADPIVLNDAGIVANGSGAPKPIYYADDEDYFVEVYTEAAWPDIFSEPTGSPIQTVDNWNSNLADFPIPSIEDSNLTNYMLNPQFRYFDNQQLTNNDLPDSQNVPLAEEGWFFYRDTNNSTNQIDFVEFSTGQTDVPFNPKYYLRFRCTSAGTETRKDLCLPFNDVITFAGETMSFALWGRSLAVNPINIQLIFRQFFGSGGSSVVETTIETFELLPGWTQLTVLNFTVPGVSGKTIGTQGDDNLEICLRMPLNQIADLGIVNNQLNQSNILFDFNYVTPETERVRKKAYELPNGTNDDYGHPVIWDGFNFVFVDDTGKVESYMLGDLPFYCTEMAGQTLKRLDFVPGTNDRIKWNRLYQKWEGDSSIGNGNAFGYGEDGFFPQNYNDKAIFINVKVGTVTDWADNNTGFTFSKIQDVIDYRFEAELGTSEEVIIVTNNTNGNVTDALSGTTSFIITILQQGSASLPEITQIQCVDGASITGGQYWTIHSTLIAYYVWYKVDGVGVDPAILFHTGILVNISSTDSVFQVAEATNIALETITGWTSVIEEEAALNVEVKDIGAVTAPSKGTTNFVLHITQKGTGSRQEKTDIIVREVASFTGGEYFLISNTTTNFYVWFKVDGIGTDPAVGGRTGILIELSSTEDEPIVATRIKYALLGRKFTKIQTVAASSLSGGEYFLVYNVVTAFYVWITIDGVGTDPQVAAKEGIELQLSATDTAIQVAVKLAKQLSSYYFVIPTAEGYFLRGWNNGSSNDPDADERIGADNIHIGDKVGTFQNEKVGPHIHSIGFGSNAGFNSTIIAGKDSYVFIGYQNSRENKGVETRPINIYVQFAIKY
jgi:hypothetical protein